MSREIKFRALSIHGKRDWQVGTYNKTCLYPNSFTGDYINDLLIDVETLGEFAGLKDKNGVDIYEGDIIRELCGADNYLKSKVVFGIHSIGKDDWGVEHISPMFCKEWLDGSGYGGLNLMSSYEVIGNIHQNPNSYNQNPFRYNYLE